MSGLLPEVAGNEVHPLGLVDGPDLAILPVGEAEDALTVPFSAADPDRRGLVPDLLGQIPVLRTTDDDGVLGVREVDDQPTGNRVDLSDRPRGQGAPGSDALLSVALLATVVSVADESDQRDDGRRDDNLDPLVHGVSSEVGAELTKSNPWFLT